MQSQTHVASARNPRLLLTLICGPPVMRTACAPASAIKSARDRPSAGVPCSFFAVASITFLRQDRRHPQQLRLWAEVGLALVVRVGWVDATWAERAAGIRTSRSRGLVHAHPANFKPRSSPVHLQPSPLHSAAGPAANKRHPSSCRPSKALPSVSTPHKPRFSPKLSGRSSSYWMEAFTPPLPAAALYEPGFAMGGGVVCVGSRA